jgi:hypothetical protein
MFYSLPVLVLVLLGLSQALAIYPPDHFDYSTKLTVDTFDDQVKSAVDSGKTLMVRWIASAGWGWWRKQAPAWNSIVKSYAGSDDVVFGDINLSEQRIVGHHAPGKGGWPTIRYFNKDTGYEGKSYTKKTTQSMCNELGQEGYMDAYVREAASLPGSSEL